MLFMKIWVTIIHQNKLFDDVKADMEANKELSTILTELVLRGRKLNISLVFLSRSYFKVPKTED